MTKESLAAQLNGREYGDEMRSGECLAAKADGLVILFGASDDLAEFRGAIDDEIGCDDGGTLRLHLGGILNAHEQHCDCHFCGYEAVAKRCATIEALWCKEVGYSWTYKTSIPHSTFEIIEGDDKYCRGIVFELSSLPEVAK